MKIHRMTASFGRLEQAELELNGGLNVIHAPNEGGKSTWCGFLKAMFYGIPTRDRDKKGYLADKNRYQPWSGAPMEGEVQLTWQDRAITLRRFAKGSSPFSGFSAVYTGTDEPVPGLTADNCGTVLLGVGREVWERSAFVGQSPTLAIDGTPELERRIAALFSSGEEEVSFSQTQRCLRDWQNRRQHNKTGIIPRLEEELTAVNAELDRMEQINRRIAQAQARQLTLKRQLSQLEDELHIHRRLAQRALNQRYAQAMEDLRQLEGQREELAREQARYGSLPSRERLTKAQEELAALTVLDEQLRLVRRQEEQAVYAYAQAVEQGRDPRFSGLTGEEAAAQAAQDTARICALDEQAARERKRRPLLPLPGLILGAAQVVAGLLIRQSMFPFLFGGLGLFGAVTLLLVLQSNRKLRALQSDRAQLLNRYTVSRPEDIAALAADYGREESRIRHAQAEAGRLQAARVSSEDRLLRAGGALLDVVRSFAPAVHDLSGCSAALSAALSLGDRLRACDTQLELTRRRCDDLQLQGAQEFDTLEMLWPPQRTQEQTQEALERVRAELTAADNQLAMARGELLGLGNPARLDARREELEGQLARRREEYDALTLALDGLQQANSQLQERFAPELNRRSGQILSALTGGRYHALTLNREFEASALSRDGILPRSALALSRGTADQLYLAVRLAVCQLCLPEEDPSPLVLDDALLTFDDERMALALDYLAGLDRQVLLFSCQQRESRYLEGRGDASLCRLH